MFVQTHRSVRNAGQIEGEATYTVYRDKARGFTLTHSTVRRGGCLYVGEVSLLKLGSGDYFTFTVKQGPWPEETGPCTAQSYWERHQDKLQ